MLALAAYPLGETFVFLDPSRGAPAGQVGDQVVGAYDDLGKLAELAKRCRVVTYEFESVPVAAARFLEAHAPVYPPPRALEVAQDRLREKNFVAELGIATSPYFGVSTREELDPRGPRARLAARRQDPALRLRRQGPGGDAHRRRTSQPRGRRSPARRSSSSASCPSCASCRSSACAARTAPSASGRWSRTVTSAASSAAPPRRRRSLQPADAAARAGRRRRRSPRSILDALDYVGVLAVELFDTELRPGGERDGPAGPQQRPPGPSRARSPASSRTTSAPSSISRSATPLRRGPALAGRA